MSIQRVVGAVLIAVLLPTAQIAGSRMQGQASAERATLKPQQVFKEQAGFPIDISADGRRVVLVTQSFGRGTDASPSQLLVRDVRTSETTKLEPGSSSFGPGGRPEGVLSPDLTRIAYVWTESAPEVPVGVRTNLSITGVKPEAPRKLAGQGTVPHGWFPDGRSLLTLIHGTASDPISFTAFSVEDGTQRPIKTFEPWRNAADPRLSPDGALIAFTAFPLKGAGNRHVYVIDTAGQNERVVATVEGSNERPIWTTDGSHLLFVNERAGRSTLYGIRVSRAGDLTPALRLQEDFRGSLLRVSNSGDLFYYSNTDEGFHQMIASRRRNGSRIVQSFAGLYGAWSKDGGLAFFRPDVRGVIVRSAETGQEHVLEHPVNRNVPPVWLRNSNAVMVHLLAAADGGRQGGSFYRIDLPQGTLTRMFAKDTAERVRSLYGGLSADGKTLFLPARARNAGSKWTHVVGVDISTGMDRVVSTLPGDGFVTPPAIAVSPDGFTLAISLDKKRLMIVNVDGTASRELAVDVSPLSNPGETVPQRGAPVGMIKWTPDGKSLIVAASTVGSSLEQWRVVTVSASTGRIESIDLDSSKLDTAIPLRNVGTITSLDVTADGSRYAFSSRTDPTYAVWKLPNIVSALKGR